ncbi:MAG TPA: hypothetical protein VNT55_14710, partial [Baekduia sp.]|nr:hypothetical protein [Baekduia sp.]
DLLYWTTAYITEYNDRAGPKTKQYRMYKSTSGSTSESKTLPLPPLDGDRYRVQFKHRIKYPAEVKWWTGPTPWSKTISCGVHGNVDTCWFEVSG